MPCVISYVPAADVSVALVVNAPVNFGVCPLTCPLYVYVNSGFAAPYVFDFAAAVTVNVFCVIVNVTSFVPV